PQSLKQLRNGLLQQSAGPVTAISARLTTSQKNTVLYYATFDGQDATVWERVLQHPVTTDPNFRDFPNSLYPVNSCLTPPPAPTEGSLYVCPPRPVRTYRNASVSALQVLPTQIARAPGDLPTGSIDTPLPVLCDVPDPSGVGCVSGGLEGGRLAVALRELVPPSNNPLVLSNSGQVRIIDPALPPQADASETSTDPLFRITRFFPNGPPDNPYIVEPPIIPNSPAQPPVRQLLTHARAYLTAGATDAGLLPDGGVPLPVLAYEGTRLFGVLDESSCFGAQTCTGILAVDADPRLPDAGDNANYGLLSFDDSDCLRDVPGGQTCIFEVGATNRMLAMRLGRGIIQGVAVAAETTFPTPVGLGLVPLLGIATVSGIGDGTAQIFFFDALGLRFINETVGVGIVGTGVSLVVPNVGTSIIDAGPNGLIPLTIGVGLYPDSETINIVNQAPIPTLGLVDGLPDAGLLPDGTRGLVWPVDGGTLAAANVVEVGDNLLPVNLSGTYCQVALLDAGSNFQCQDVDPTLACVTVRGVEDGGTAIFTDPIDLSLCPGVSGYSVQTGHGSTLPFLVVGSVNGVLGRMTSGTSADGGPQTFRVPNAISVGIGKTYPRFYNPDVDAGVRIVDNLIVPPGAPVDAGTLVFPLTLQLPAIDTVFFYNQGAYYTFIFASGFLRSSLPLDTSSIGFQALYLPGGVATTRVRDVNGEFVLVLIAYPSGNAVIDFIPDEIIPNNPNAGAITVHF
ncbi:MAG TPA: hypothetical protein VK454_09520, partial [Myxococcaceae bacterium]|nr:hypothetical protein [Myxococcaceae bacterium]